MKNDFKTIQYIIQKALFYLGAIIPSTKNMKTFHRNKKRFVIWGDQRHRWQPDQTIEGKIHVTGRDCSRFAHIYIKHYRFDAAVHAAMRPFTADSTAGGGYGYASYVDRGPIKNGYDGQCTETRGDTVMATNGNSMANTETRLECRSAGRMGIRTILKPSRENSLQNQWIWDNGMLLWDSNPGPVKLEDGGIRPMWPPTFRQW